MTIQELYDTLADFIENNRGDNEVWVAGDPEGNSLRPVYEVSSSNGTITFWPA